MSVPIEERTFPVLCNCGNTVFKVTFTRALYTEPGEGRGEYNFHCTNCRETDDVYHDSREDV